MVYHFPVKNTCLEKYHCPVKNHLPRKINILKSKPKIISANQIAGFFDAIQIFLGFIIWGFSRGRDSKQNQIEPPILMGVPKLVLLANEIVGFFDQKYLRNKFLIFPSNFCAQVYFEVRIEVNIWNCWIYLYKDFQIGFNIIENILE